MVTIRNDLAKVVRAAGLWYSEPTPRPTAARAKKASARYHRIARRRGKQRAIVAVGNPILTITWHLQSDPAAQFTDLGPDWHDRIAPARRKRQLIHELERLTGSKVTLQEAPAA